MAQVADAVILPRFGRLAAGEVTAKTPGDFVTIADREAEAMLAEGLTRIDPGARVIGEEACAADPSLLDAIGWGDVWLVDPLDGTNNFAEGITPFGTMIALIADGVVTNGWLYDPVARRLCHAALGGGAFLDGARVYARGTGQALPVATFSSYWIDADRQRAIAARAAGVLDLRTGMRAAAAQYPALVDGTHDLARFERVHPWDHAAGALFLGEAGGYVARLDGSAYRVGDPGPGLLAAASRALWDRGIAALAG